MTPDQKLNLIIQQLAGLTDHCKHTENRIKTVSRRSHSNSQKIESLKISLEEKVKYLEGRNVRLETQVEDMARKLEDLEFRSKRHNIVIHGLLESGDEKARKRDAAKRTAYEFFKSTMQCTETNKISIDIAHRMGGEPGSGRPRPLVVYMQTRTSKDYVMSKVTNLVDGRISVNEQLPKPMVERRLSQLQEYKKLRTNLGKDKVKLVRDRLVVNGKVKEQQLVKNPLKPMAAAVDAEEIVWTQTEQQTENKSIFWGQGTPINSIEDAQEGLAKILEEDENAKATHIVYAYRFTDEKGVVVEGHDDNGEVGASRILMEELCRINANAIIAVLRHYGGRNLGPKRFKLYREHAQALMTGLQEAEGQGSD